MLNNYKSNIVLKFFKIDEGGGEPKEASVTLSNVRENLTEDEIKQVGTAFASLIKHPMSDIELVQFSRIA